MKIVFVVAGLRNGGAEREMTVFASALAELEQEVHIVCTRDLMNDYEIDSRVCMHYMPRIQRVRIPKLRVLFRWWKAMPGLRSLHADILLPVCLPLKYYPCIWRSTLFSRTKLLYVVRNNQEQKYISKKDRHKWKRVTYLSDGIWIQVKEQRQFFPGSYAKKIFEVSNILDPRFLQIPVHERGKICRFISVGRFHRQKNQKLIIMAFAEMLKRLKDPYITLTIYGQSMPWNDSVEEELKVLIHKYRLENRIFFPGRVKEIEKCYEEADAFVLSSDYEGLPNVLMEAMAAGLPCISTDCRTGPSTLIKNGENGLLVPVGNVEAMTQAMEYVVCHPQQAFKMGTEARKRMLSWESREELAEKLLENLRRICR